MLPSPAGTRSGLSADPALAALRAEFGSRSTNDSGAQPRGRDGSNSLRSGNESGCCGNLREQREMAAFVARFERPTEPERDEIFGVIRRRASPSIAEAIVGALTSPVA